MKVSILFVVVLVAAFMVGAVLMAMLLGVTLIALFWIYYGTRYAIEHLRWRWSYGR